jgi:hypothetical protein
MNATADADAREDAVVEAVVSGLNSSSPAGLHAAVVDRPDRTGARPGMTTDTLISLSARGKQTLWALDVIAVPWQERLTPAIREFMERTEEPLEKLLADSTWGWFVFFTPRPGDRKEGAKDAARALAAAQTLVAAGSPGVVEEDDLTVELRRVSVEPQVSYMYSVTTETRVSDELWLTFADPAFDKLTGQLHLASLLGKMSATHVELIATPTVKRPGRSR